MMPCVLHYRTQLAMQTDVPAVHASVPDLAAARRLRLSGCAPGSCRTIRFVVSVAVGVSRVIGRECLTSVFGTPCVVENGAYRTDQVRIYTRGHRCSSQPRADRSGVSTATRDR